MAENVHEFNKIKVLTTKTYIDKAEFSKKL